MLPYFPYNIIKVPFFIYVYITGAIDERRSEFVIRGFEIFGGSCEEKINITYFVYPPLNSLDERNFPRKNLLVLYVKE